MSSRTTSFGLVYDLSDTTALDDAIYSGSNIEAGDLSDLKNEDNISTGTCPFWSLYVANEFGEFEEDEIPSLTIDFTTYHSSYAISLYFLRDPATKLRITYMRDNTVAYRNTFEIEEMPDATIPYVISQAVQSYNKIIIEFLGAGAGYNVSLGYVRFGILVNWDETNVKTATLVQELNRVSNMLSINTLSFDVIDVGDALNFGNRDGIHNFYQRKQVIQPYEMINDTRIELGTFFLDTFSNENNLGKMTAVSYMGVLDEVDFNEGQVYDGVKASVVINKIFEVAKVDNYIIDNVIGDKLLYGTIPPKTCREALRDVLFTCNGVIDTTDVSTIKITSPSEVILPPITRGEKFSTKVSTNKYVSDVEVKYDTFTLDDEVAEINKQEYTAGNYTIIFSEPYENVYVNGTATITSSNTYYVKINVPTTQEITIYGTPYEKVTKSIVKSTPYISPGQTQYKETFSTSLCNEESANNLANILFEYYTKYTLTVNVKHIAKEITMNNLRYIDNSIKGLHKYLGGFSSRTFDLTGGFIDTAQLIGYFDTQDENYFAGEEIYANDNFII